MSLILKLLKKNHLLGKKGLVVSNDKNKKMNLPNIVTILKPKLNQLFQIKHFEEESFDYIIDIQNQLKTKFYPIVMLEYFYKLKLGGKLLLHLNSKNEHEIFEFKGKMGILLRGKFRVFSEVQTKNGLIVILDKLKSNNYNQGGINNWTFGIVTGGQRKDWIEKQIQSIISQNVPNFEIIICGDYYKRPEKFIKYIHLHEDPPRITTKKNEICRKAKYENIMVMHDRIFLDKDWFNGMKKFGNLWDSIGCRLLLNGKRSYDWISAGATRIHWGTKFLNNALLEYNDWDPYVSEMGAIHIFKKSAWEIVNFNEGMYYPDVEDKLFCHELTFSGHIMRFNPYSLCTTVRDQELYLRKHKFNYKKLGRVVPETFGGAIIFYIYSFLFHIGILNFILTYFKGPVYKIASKLGNN